MHEGRIVGGSSTLENLPKPKTSWPESEERRRGQSDAWFFSCLTKVHGNEAEKPDCSDCPAVWTGRWIRQPVKRCPNNQQAQQTCRDLGFHSLVAPLIYTSEKSVLRDHWPRQQRHPLFIRCNILHGSLQRNGDRPQTRRWPWRLVGLKRATHCNEKDIKTGRTHVAIFLFIAPPFGSG